MTRTTVRAGLLVVTMAVGCGGNSLKSRAPDAGGWTTVPAVHDAGRSDASRADARASHDAGIDAKVTRDAGTDAKATRDASTDAKATHDASADAKSAHDAGTDAQPARDARPDAIAPLGGACASNAECAGGFCVDGVCCNSACRGACVSCALPFSIGTCSPAPVGSVDPHATCTDQGPASCGQNGTCDGAGGCARYAADTLCMEASCSGEVWTSSGVCDGAGTCVPGTGLNCFPYACANATCWTSCSDPSDCATGQVCMAGTCGNGRVGGTTCTGDTDCNSGICSQGVCCASRCNGVCNSCGLPGTLGTCEPVPSNQRPDGSVCP